MKLVVRSEGAAARGAQDISLIGAEGVEATFTVHNDLAGHSPAAEVRWGPSGTGTTTHIEGGLLDAAVELAALLRTHADRSLVVHPTLEVRRADVYPPGRHPSIEIAPDR